MAVRIFHIVQPKLSLGPVAPTAVNANRPFVNKHLPLWLQAASMGGGCEHFTGVGATAPAVFSNFISVSWFFSQTLRDGKCKCNLSVVDEFNVFHRLGIPSVDEGGSRPETRL